ncbi:MAG: hypothetical protein RI894_1657 [Bacteroidota bacterium]|jgi:nitrite reductase/ring-hydroxylating ferredoxin subunit
MERKEFLAQLGLGAVFVLTSTCLLDACTKDTTTTPTAVDFTIDINGSAYSALATNGGYIVANGVVVARSLTGTYVAATVTCSHEGRTQITYNSSGKWYCTAHGALFSETGAGLNNNGSKNLTVYKTQLSGTSLRVYS